MEHFGYVRRNPVEWQFCCDEPSWGNIDDMRYFRIPGDEQEQNGEERAFLGQDRRFELVWLERLRRGEDKRNHNHEVVHVGVSGRDRNVVQSELSTVEGGATRANHRQSAEFHGRRVVAIRRKCRRSGGKPTSAYEKGFPNLFFLFWD